MGEMSFALVCTGLLYGRRCMLFKVYCIVGLLVLDKTHIPYGLLCFYEFRCVAEVLLFHFFWLHLVRAQCRGALESLALSVLVQVFVWAAWRHVLWYLCRLSI